eukprot:GHVU01141928.1.p1 GENE.GHVU01141928.1~~GHVU01141928.1.p1  ORF type:complete len:137 (+),score=10.59 GHVU01141928.1:313-723(+)
MRSAASDRTEMEGERETEPRRGLIITHSNHCDYYTTPLDLMHRINYSPVLHHQSIIQSTQSRGTYATASSPIRIHRRRSPTTITLPTPHLYTLYISISISISLSAQAASLSLSERAATPDRMSHIPAEFARPLEAE